MPILSGQTWCMISYFAGSPFLDPMFIRGLWNKWFSFLHSEYCMSILSLYERNAIHPYTINNVCLVYTDEIKFWCMIRDFAGTPLSGSVYIRAQPSYKNNNFDPYMMRTVSLCCWDNFLIYDQWLCGQASYGCYVLIKNTCILSCPMFIGGPPMKHMIITFTR